jgi:hypothetical protein
LFGRKKTMLASQVLNEFEVVESPLSICTDAYDHGILSSTVCESSRPARETGSPSASKPEGLRCVRGSMFALAFEVAMALCVYGIWEAWRLLR